MKYLPYLLISIVLLHITACKPNSKSAPELPEEDKQAATIRSDTSTVAPPADPAHNSRLSVDWQGTYRGTLPCEDCDGVQTSLTLFESGDFTRDRTYAGKSEKLVTDSGIFTWDDSGGIITLKPDNNDPVKYQVGENVLFKLNPQGKRYTDAGANQYELQKNFNDPRIEDIKWELVELGGQEVNLTQTNRNPGLTLHSELGQITGNDGCNVFVASYNLAPGGQVTFGETAQSLKACPDQNLVYSLAEVLQRADNYTVNDGILSLNKARMAPLAKFKAAN